MVGINEAAGAYSTTLNQLKAGGTTSSEGNSSVFGDLVKQSLTTAIDAQHKSEQVSAAALSGKADITDVVQALNEAEIALNTVMAVRDKVIDAYNNILHTSI